MFRATKLTSTLITLIIFMLDCHLVSAGTRIIPAIDSGWYSETGFHAPSNLNYIVGDYRRPGVPDPKEDVRNFFVFDLSRVTQPIVSANLELTVPAADGYGSADPSENYELHDVVTSLAALLDGTGGVAAHADLGSGIVYGNRLMSDADEGQLVEITLNSSAIAALNSSHGPFGIGGSITTLDGLANREVVFGNSGGPGFISQLRLEVPEPSSLAQFVLLSLLLSASRRVRRR
jgi:hypothetical protein